jgi:cation transporter-like permease
MKRTVRALLLLLLAGAPLLLVAQAFGSGPERIWLKAPGWSRARVVGATAPDLPAPLAADGAGGAYLFLVHAEGGARYVRALALDERAAVRWEHTFPTALAGLSSPQILWDGRALTLLWISEERLYAAELDAAGSPRGEPRRLSGELRVASYGATSDGRGRRAVWLSGAQATPGLYAADLEGAGEPELLVADGERPALRFDGAGALHTLWTTAGDGRAATVWYAVYAGGAYRAGGERALTEIAIGGPGAAIDGPWLGLDDGHSYVLWSTFFRAGMNAGTSLAQYVAFPLGRPGEATEARPISVPGSADLPYDERAAGELQAGPRLPLAGWFPAQGGPPTGLALDGAGRGEQALAAEVRLSFRGMQQVNGVGTLFFRDGAPDSYQLLSYGRRSAFGPALASDEAGRLYVTWRELRGTGAVVYYASTAPAAREALAALSADDVMRVAAEILFGMLTGLVVAPFMALFWLAPALLTLLPTWFLRRGDAGLEGWGSRLSLALALGAYWAIKLVMLSGALAIVPFSAWLPAVPPWLGPLLQGGTPVLIAAASLWAAWALSYGRGVRSVALFVVVYGAIDSLGTMAIYGEALFGG